MHQVYSAALASAATFCAIAAGFSLNDRLDIYEDQINNRARPVASGSVSRRSAVAVYCVCAITAIICATLLPSAQGSVVVVVMLFLVSAYSTHLKRVWYLKNLTIAVAVTLIPVLAMTVTSGWGSPASVVWGIFFFSLEKEILMDIRDINGDRQAGIITFPIRTSRAKSAISAVVINIACWICVLPLLVRTIWGEALVWIVIALLHTGLVWWISSALSIRWVRMYLHQQILITTTVCVILLMR